jgi:hypothetical protein
MPRIPYNYKADMVELNDIIIELKIKIELNIELNELD